MTRHARIARSDSRRWPVTSRPSSSKRVNAARSGGPKPEAGCVAGPLGCSGAATDATVRYELGDAGQVRVSQDELCGGDVLRYPTRVARARNRNDEIGR